MFGPQSRVVSASVFAIATLAVLYSACSDAAADAGSFAAPVDDAGVRAAPDAASVDTAVANEASAITVDAAMPVPEVIFPRTGINAAELGVVVNDSDPLSVSVASYYMAARKIPAANLVHVQIADTNGSTLSETDFAPLKTQVDRALASTPVQALLLTWTKPFAVGNMSITSAFAMGYRAIGDTCNDPKSQFQSMTPYASNRASTRPFTDLAFRPTMTLPATTIDEAKALIDRGVASDDTWPQGSAYLMNTSDQIRSARCIVNTSYGWTNECQKLIDKWDSSGSGVSASIVVADSIAKKTDVFLYVQGLASVPDISTNTFLPGAVADHLTSYGGQIPTSGQMSAFEFIKGGATGSYGTVVEPCAHQQKFPDPSVLLPHYFGGNTLIEAYWKSVAWPAEGIFIGEPLARPFGSGFKSEFVDGALTIRTSAMLPGVTYLVEAADSSSGPFVTVLDALSVAKHQIATFKLPAANRRTYRFRAK